MWTEAQVSTLKEHLADAGSIRAAADILGKSFATVQGYMKDHGLRPTAQATIDLNRSLADKTPLPVAPAIPGIDPSVGITVDALTATACKFIAGTPCGEDTLYCGRPIHLGSYCEAHAALCYVPRDKRRVR